VKSLIKVNGLANYAIEKVSLLNNWPKFINIAPVVEKINEKDSYISAIAATL
jgi:hypothetical protein